MFKEDASESFSCGGGCRHSAPSRSWRNSVSDNPYEALRLNISWNTEESLTEPTSLTIPTATDGERGRGEAFGSAEPGEGILEGVSCRVCRLGRRADSSY